MDITESSNPLLEEIKCPNCLSGNASDRKFCSQCSFPIAGSDDDKKQFRANVARHKFLVKNAEDKISSARTIIYILAGLFFLSGIFVWYTAESFEMLLVNLIIALMYLIFASWSNSNPSGAILTAFIVYLTVQFVNFMVNPASLFSGIILKVIAIVAFVKGIQSAFEAKQSLKELEKVKAVRGGDN